MPARNAERADGRGVRWPIGALAAHGRRLEPPGREDAPARPVPAGTNVIVAAVEGPDTALDLLADLRAWQAVEEAHASRPASESSGEARGRAAGEAGAAREPPSPNAPTARAMPRRTSAAPPARPKKEAASAARMRSRIRRRMRA
ncbi:MAG: hypothetical protein KIS92_08440 [Planctomycetota bacterium]|nr:hypothetical protein [Planctomycetota bacterium]